MGFHVKETETNSDKKKFRISQAEQNGINTSTPEGKRISRDIYGTGLKDDSVEINSTLQRIASGWADTETLERGRADLADYVDRLSFASEYAKTHNIADESQKAISTLYDHYSGILNDYHSFSDIYGRYKDAGEYNRAMNNAKWSDAYKDYSFDQMQKAIAAESRRGDPEKAAWMENYLLSKDYNTSADYDKAISVATRYAQNLSGSDSLAADRIAMQKLDPQERQNAFVDAGRLRQYEGQAESLQNRKRIGEQRERIQAAKSVAFADPNYREMRGDRSTAETREDVDIADKNLRFRLGVLSPEEMEHIMSRREEYTRQYDRLGVFLSVNEDERRGYADTNALSDDGYDDLARNAVNEGIYKYWDRLTPSEIEIYYWYRREQGAEAANKFLEDIAPELSRRAEAAQLSELSQANTLEMLLYNIASVPMSVFGGIAGAVGTAANLISGNEIDPNAYYRSMQRGAADIRSESAQRIMDGIDSEGWGKFLANSYQAVMSGLDSFLGGTTMGGAYTVAMGAGAFSQRAADLAAQGVSRDKILAVSLASGITEWLTEKASWDFVVSRLAKGDKSFLRTLATIALSSVNEGVEEVNADLINNVVDEIIMGYNSEQNKRIRMYVEQGKSQEDAIAAARKDSIEDLGWSLYGGLLSGLGMTAGAYAYNAGANAYVNYRQNVDTGAAIREGGNIAGLSALSEAAGGNAVSTDNSDRKIGKTYKKTVKKNVSDINNAGKNTARDIVVRSLNDNGITAENEPKFDTLVNTIVNAKKEAPSVFGTALINKHRDASLAALNAINKAEESGAFAEERTKKQLRAFSSLAEAQKLVRPAEAKREADISEYEYGEDGKTFRLDTDTHDRVDITGIKSIITAEDGKKTAIVKLSDGSETDIRNLSLGSRDEAILYESAVQMGVSPETAQSVVNGFDPKMGISLNAYLNAAEDAVRFGRIGVDDLLTALQSKSDLPDAMLKNFYNMGKMDLERETKKATEAQKKLTGKTAKMHGTVTFDSSAQNLELNPRQNNSVNIMRALSEALGIDVEFFASPVENGKHVGENGSYKNGKIRIDIFAGVQGKDLILFTASHELTHFLAQNAKSEYNDFVRFLVSAYHKQGESINDLVALQQKKARESKTDPRELTYDEALEEVAADSAETFLRDSDLMDQVAKLAEKNMSLAQRIQKWLIDFSDAIKAIRANYEKERPDSYEGKAILRAEQDLARIRKAWADGIMAASKNYKAAGGRVVINNTHSATVAELVETTNGATDENGEELFQYRAMEHDENEYREMLTKWGKMSDEEITNLFDVINSSIKKIKENLDILDYDYERDIDDRSFNPIKQNSDSLYKVSLDFSTLCRKRILQQMVQTQLQEALNRSVTKAESIAIRQELARIQEEGRQIEIACALCYVESARMKSYDQIKKFLDNPGKVVFDYFAGKDKAQMKFKRDAAELRARQKLSGKYAAQIKSGSIVDPMSFTVTANGEKKYASLKSLPKSIADEIRNAKREANKEYNMSSWEESEVKAADTLSVADFTSPEGLENLVKNHRGVYDAYTTYIRNATKSKGYENDTWWRAGDSKGVADSLIKAMNNENGLRSQSWSDFQVIHLLDYIAATIELSTRNAKIQTYTKVPDFVRLMGNTNAMINLSLIPTREFSGSLEYDSVEGIDYATALKLRDEYPATAGTICIGINDRQIKMLLASTMIDYVIPYHQSGMSKAVRTAMNIPGWTSYEQFQNEKKLSRSDAEKNAKKYGVKLLSADDANYQKPPKFSDWFFLDDARNTAAKNKNAKDVMRGGYVAMQKAAERYKKLCAARGLAPKFSYGSTDFSEEENYWKLLIDRKMINNKTGEIIEQQAIKPVFDKKKILKILNDEVARYGRVHEDQNYATKTVVERFLSGEMNDRIRKVEKVIGAVQTAVDNVTNVNIVSNAQNSEMLSDRITAEQDAEYLSLAENYENLSEADKAKVQKMVEDAARAAGYERHDYITKSRYNTKAYQGYAKRRSDMLDRSMSAKSAREAFDIEYDFYKTNQNAIADRDTFFRDTMAKFEMRNRRPATAPDYVSRTRNGEISSEYWYTDTGVIRGSKHWGNGIRSCDWELNGVPLKKESITTTNKMYGFCAWEDFAFKDLFENNKSADPVTYDDAGNVIPLSQRFNAENEDIRYSGRIPVDLSNESRLSELIGNKVGAEKYKLIQAYILDSLGDGVTFPDGLFAKVDKSDAMHIAHKSGDKKTAEISAIKELIDSSVRFAKDNHAEHDKFKEFVYYESFARYDGDVFPIYFNVGLSKNKDGYHLYDITKNVKDTAQRLNVVERLREFRSIDGALQYDYTTTPSESQPLNDEQNVNNAGNDDVRYSDRTDSTDDRSILANALDSVAETKAQKDALSEYKAKFAEFEKLQTEYADTQKQIRELTFGKNTNAEPTTVNGWTITEPDTKTRDSITMLRKKSEILGQQIRRTDNALTRMEQNVEPLREILSNARFSWDDVQADRKRAATRYIAQQKEERAKMVREYDEMRKRAVERRDIAAVMRDTTNAVDRIKKMAEHPNTKRYIPANLVQSVGDITQKVSQVRNALAEQKIEELKRLIETTKSDKRRAELVAQLERAERRGETLADELEKLEIAFSHMENGNAEQKAVYDASGTLVEPLLKELTDELRTTPVSRLSLDQARRLNDCIRAVETAIKNANRITLEGEVVAATSYRDKLISDLHNQDGRYSGFSKQFDRPDTFFRFMGGWLPNSSWVSLYNKLNDAQLDEIRINMESSMFFDDLVSNEKELKKLRTDMVDVGLVDQNGEKVEISRGMMLHLYMNLLNRDNARVVLYGGFTMPNTKKYYAGKQGEAYGDTDQRKIRPLGNTLGDISRQIDESDREIIRYCVDQFDSASDIGKFAADLAGREQTTSNQIRTLVEMAKEYGTKEQADEIDTLNRRSIRLKQEYTVTAEQIIDDLKAKVYGQMSAWERDYVESVRDYFDNYSKELLNAVTLKELGFAKARVTNYYPMHKDQAYLDANFDTILLDATVENAGFMKERVGSSAPILMEDITDVVKGQIRKTAKYAAYLGLSLDMKKVFGKTVYDPNADYAERSLQKQIALTKGKGAMEYFEKLYRDLVARRGADSAPFAGILKKLRSNYAAAVLTLNAAVTIGQAASFPTAALLIDHKNLSKALAYGKNKDGKNRVLFYRADRELIDTYTPLLWDRNKNGLLAAIVNDNDLSNKLSEKAPWLLKWIEKTDVATVGRLWKACEYQIEQDNHALAQNRGTAEEIRTGKSKYYKEVAKLFNKVVELTQPDYQVMQRPDILRSDHDLVKGLFMFMTQRLQNWNIVRSSIAEANAMRKYAKDKKVKYEDYKRSNMNLVRALTSQLLAAITYVFVRLPTKVGLAPWKYLDDDDPAAQKILIQARDDLASAVLGILPIGSYLEDGLKFAMDRINGESTYYSDDMFALPEMSALNDIVNGIERIAKNPTPKNIESLAFKVAESLGGIPVSNAKKIVKAILYYMDGSDEEQ